MKKTRMDIKGQKFGRLTALEYAFTNSHKQSVWRCVCECGTEIFTTGSHLVSGHTQSCGCSKIERMSNANKTHGLTKTRLHRIWSNMKTRCTNKKTPCYSNYGGRGISVCDEWLNSFEAFRDWAVQNGYSNELSIDRIDVNGNYSPDNCRWTTQKEQMNNVQANKHITFNGETHTLKEWADLTGINYGTLYSRYRAGKSPEVILKRKEV